MPISDWSTDPEANGTALTVDIAEGMNARDVNNAMREIMAGVREYTDDPRIGGDLTAGVQLMRADGAVGMTGNLSMQSFKVKDIPWPDAATDNDAVPASWVDAFYQKKGGDLTNTLWPAAVGPVIITLTNVNPSVWLGGVWIQICQGRFSVGAGTTTDSRGEGRTFVVGETGGEYQNVLGIPQMPPHDHSYSATHGTAFGGDDTGTDNPNGARRTGVTGGGLPHNNVPPYLAMYFWQRIS